ncbi:MULTISPECIES: glutaredoxin family protein [Anoxybacillus]|jgi:glutaredoxin-like protein NrdH|uniref:glutaredoxin family protein n=1 Tax=Anoxybacillus TaxID=150247 RepID=UPI0007D9EB01|nr:glutaredoxin family protein [Anoxybacillus flavithermus]ASA97435.1 glutaredoxin family protein [Anoxybacillus flavithermus]MBE2906507.1 glutaredoxin family protein [Anoxybacillus flavithermus]MBE2908648.1 glutaredoxin family protein [Anoxybacillus flavithermus]MBE2911646.1 glutaredoxin family protein [Anoxybacillus flavithermus]MBE2916864.1 glutaredoxin family protein [Anoxybacillus flavithermus]
MEIIMYSTKHCIYCKKQKDFLSEKGIAFEERDIHENEEFFQEFKDLGGYGTPFTIIKENGNIVSKILGFNQNKLLEKLTK